MEFTNASEILDYVGVKFPSSIDLQWADACASAVNDGIMIRLNGALLVDPLVVSELHLAALMAGGEAYKRREAPFGVTGFSDMEGSAIRIAKDYLESVRPLIDRYSNGPGIG